MWIIAWTTNFQSNRIYVSVTVSASVGIGKWWDDEAHFPQFFRHGQWGMHMKATSNRRCRMNVSNFESRDDHQLVEVLFAIEIVSFIFFSSLVSRWIATHLCDKFLACTHHWLEFVEFFNIFFSLLFPVSNRHFDGLTYFCTEHGSDSWTSFGAFVPLSFYRSVCILNDWTENW